MTTTRTSTDPAVIEPCERCRTPFQRPNKQASLTCPDCRKRRASARHTATDRARTWLARQHPKQYRELYQRHLTQARAQDPAASATRIGNRARNRALAELQRRYPDAYRQRYADELARARAAVDARVEHQAAHSPSRAPYWQRDATAERHAYTTARYRALLWLARLYSDTTAQLHAAEAARLPLNPADRTPEKRRALAWVRTLDQLSRLHPDDFQARYRAELARTAEGQGDGVVQAADQAQGS